jgi:catechol 2,3-dioxygenase-like lactoylglutathione lyase family enzyme
MTQAPIARFTRLRHATFTSPDPERLLDYYRAVIGLGLVARDGGRLFLANESKQLSLVIEPGDAALRASRSKYPLTSRSRRSALR